MLQESAKNVIFAALKQGSVVQLYRTSDSGSEGRGLESRRGHKYETKKAT